MSRFGVDPKQLAGGGRAVWLPAYRQAAPEKNGVGNPSFPVSASPPTTDVRGRPNKRTVHKKEPENSYSWGATS